MQDCVSGNIRRVESRFGDSEFKQYLDSFKLDCIVRSLTPKTIDVYFERLGYFFHYLQERDIGFETVTKATIRNYILSLNGNVSGETINGRIRACKRFFNYLKAEGLWEGENPATNVKLLKTPQRIKAVLSPDDFQKIVTQVNRKRFEDCRCMSIL